MSKQAIFGLAIHILRSHDDLHQLLAPLPDFRFWDRASTFAAKMGKDVVWLPEKKVIVVICAGKSNIRRVDDICTWTEMWKQIQKMSSLDSRHKWTREPWRGQGQGHGGKRAIGQKGKRAKTTNCNFPQISGMIMMAVSYHLPVWSWSEQEETKEMYNDEDRTRLYFLHKKLVL